MFYIGGETAGETCGGHGAIKIWHGYMIIVGRASWHRKQVHA